MRRSRTSRGATPAGGSGGGDGGAKGLVEAAKDDDEAVEGPTEGPVKAAKAEEGEPGADVDEAGSSWACEGDNFLTEASDGGGEGDATMTKVGVAGSGRSAVVAAEIVVP